MIWFFSWIHISRPDFDYLVSHDHLNRSISLLLSRIKRFGQKETAWGLLNDKSQFFNAKFVSKTKSIWEMQFIFRSSNDQRLLTQDHEYIYKAKRKLFLIKFTFLSLWAKCTEKHRTNQPVWSSKAISNSRELISTLAWFFSRPPSPPSSFTSKH